MVRLLFPVGSGEGNPGSWEVQYCPEGLNRFCSFLLPVRALLGWSSVLSCRNLVLSTWFSQPLRKPKAVSGRGAGIPSSLREILG